MMMITTKEYNNNNKKNHNKRIAIDYHLAKVASHPDQVMSCHVMAND